MILMLGAMFAIIYFMLIRPQKKQQDEHQRLLAALKKGDEVILSSGVYGKVYAVDERTAVIEVAKDTRIKVLKSAVAALAAPAAEEKALSPSGADAGTAVDSESSQSKSADSGGKKSKPKKKKSA